MNLSTFFAEVHPILSGERAAGKRRDFGSEDLLRLSAQLSRSKRSQILAAVYPKTRSALLARLGEAEWRRLESSYFRRHPPRSFSFLECARGFAGDLRRSDRCPPWARELAELELALSEVYVAATARPSAPPAGELRLNPTLRFLTASHALLEWLPSGGGEPPSRQCVILIWRDSKLETRLCEVEGLALAMLAGVQENGSVDPSIGDGLDIWPDLQRLAEALIDSDVIQRNPSPTSGFTSRPTSRF